MLNLLTRMTLMLMAALFNYRPALNRYLKGTDGWMNFIIGMKTASGSVAQAIVFCNGRVSVPGKIPEDADAVMVFVNERVLRSAAGITPNDMLNLVLKNKIILEGNMAYLQAFNFLVSLVMGRVHTRMLKRAAQKEIQQRKSLCRTPGLSATMEKRFAQRLSATAQDDPGVKYLEDPYLSAYGLDDFPGLKADHGAHFKITPAISAERPRLMTEWFRENGFETDAEGNPWFPELRQAHAFKYLMEQKQAVIRPGSLLAGTCAPEEVAVIIYPDTTGTMIWGELGSIDQRFLNPCHISAETAAELHDIFPFWAKRITREWIRDTYHYPLCQKIDERAVASFNFKTVSLSHTVPDVSAFVNRGTHALMAEIRDRMAELGPEESEKQDTLESMILCLEGLNAFAGNLAREAEQQAADEPDPGQKGRLEQLHRICRRVPMAPARDMDEAMNALWIFWIALVMENNNVSLSPGRLDQILQPFFERDMARLGSQGARTKYIEHVIELIGCFFIRNAEHQNLVPDVANYLFSGSHAETAITLGGVTPDGEDAVNDMTYIFLKVTEMLSMRDPNMNARYKTGVNSDTYLKRLCEVNYIAVATPSMHGDDAVMETLFHNYSDRMVDVRDWAVTGCVELTLSGKHMNHGGATSINMVAALEMALNNGYHPLMDWHLGPETGEVAEEGAFPSFDAFFEAYAAQVRFIIEHTVAFNNMAAEAYAYLRPTPLLSVGLQGAVDNAVDVTRGGARYNTSGTFNIGLADVVDSMMVIKKLVFEDKTISFGRLKAAVDSDFDNDPALHSIVMNKVPRFGSGDEDALAMANRVAALIYDSYKAHKNYRGGEYTVGFWSVAQHSAYGNLSGAIPAGRRAFQPFTPGLTPHPSASKSFLDNIRDVASMDPRHMDNNIAFNVRLVPSAKDSRQKTVDTMFSYVKSYFEMGGMQIQFNMVTTEVLKDAMANPEQYQNLLVRISGYNAYFVHLSTEMQLEIIERAEFGL